MYDRYHTVRIYWLWSDENIYGSNFESVMRRMEKFGSIQQQFIYKI